MCSHTVYPAYPLAPSPVPSLMHIQEQTVASGIAQQACDRLPLPGTASVLKPKPSRHGWERRSKDMKLDCIRLLTSTIALLNQQLKLEHTKMLLLSTSVNQYSASGCARLRWKRAGDELDASSEAGPLQRRKCALKEGRLKRMPGSAAS